MQLEAAAADGLAVAVGDEEAAGRRAQLVGRERERGVDVEAGVEALVQLGLVGAEAPLGVVVGRIDHLDRHLAHRVGRYRAEADHPPPERARWGSLSGGDPAGSPHLHGGEAPAPSGAGHPCTHRLHHHLWSPLD